MWPLLVSLKPSPLSPCVCVKILSILKKKLCGPNNIISQPNFIYIKVCHFHPLSPRRHPQIRGVQSSPFVFLKNTSSYNNNLSTSYKVVMPHIYQILSRNNTRHLPYALWHFQERKKTMHTSLSVFHYALHAMQTPTRHKLLPPSLNSEGVISSLFISHHSWTTSISIYICSTQD